MKCRTPNGTLHQCHSLGCTERVHAVCSILTYHREQQDLSLGGDWQRSAHAQGPYYCEEHQDKYADCASVDEGGMLDADDFDQHAQLIPAASQASPSSVVADAVLLDADSMVDVLPPVIDELPHAGALAHDSDVVMTQLDVPLVQGTHTTHTHMRACSCIHYARAFCINDDC